MQLAITGAKFCYLVIWNAKKKDFWTVESAKAKTFFYKILFPEILDKYFNLPDSKKKWLLMRGETGKLI